jgi:tetratricopeptide (TPR) repeat protein
VLALLAVLAVWRWTTKSEVSLPSSSLPSPVPRATSSRGSSVGPTRLSHPVQPLAAAAQRSPGAAAPPPAVFDFAKMTPPAQPQRTKEERFRTNARFTQDDLEHPERYFAAAERVPELNRPEERRDALDYFLAYREKLQRDLEVAGEDQERRKEILVVIERYDAAIARLRKLIDDAGTK